MNEDDFMVEYMKRLFQLVSLAVWTNEGVMYMPVWGYDNQIEAYAPTAEASVLFNEWVFEHDPSELTLTV